MSMLEEGCSRLVITGIPDDDSGTGRFVSHILSDLQARRWWDVRIVCSPKGRPVSDALKRVAQAVPQLLILHPQYIGMRSVIEMMEKRARGRRSTDLFILDNSFFCVRSYNYRRELAGPCLECVGTSSEPSLRLGCRPLPVDDKFAHSYVARLRTLVNAASVRLFAQSKTQAELARLHFGPGIRVTTAGLWCRDWDPVFAGVLSSRLFARIPCYDVLFHGPLLGAKGAEWTWRVAALCPELTFLLPFAPAVVRTKLPENVVLSQMNWTSGLQQAVRTGRITLVPSLWSAATEGALIKSIVDAPVVGVVDIPSAYSHQLPDGLVARLPADPASAATMLRDLLTSGWRPDSQLKERWVDEFSAFNRPVLERLFPEFPVNDCGTAEIRLEFDGAIPVSDA